MKMASRNGEPSRFLTALNAVLIALVFGALNYALWSWMNRPADPVDFDGRVKGFAFNGFQRHQSPWSAPILPTMS